ncbi:phosphotransferase [Pleionea sediminis]|uniref:phosphotransferase n=1 Tax=Pleionea sediminis TaxID=2569479 RepID=UPI0013DE0A41|nr:phosphotransferase [Pleionea sediminis]
MKSVEELLLLFKQEEIFSDGVEVVAPLPSDTNECWLIKDEASSLSKKNVSKGVSLWVLKCLRQDELSISYDVFIKNTQQAENLNLTPPLSYHDEESRCLIVPYRESGNLSNVSWSKNKKIELAAKSLSLIHDSNMNFQPMDLYQEVEQYLSMLENISDQTKYMAKIAELPALPERNYFANIDTHCPCHMDLSFENLLANGEILDWEYARQALPLVDIASCATINELTNDEANLLFQKYCSYRNINASSEHFTIYCQWTKLLNQIWYQVADQATERQFS